MEPIFHLDPLKNEAKEARLMLNFWLTSSLAFFLFLIPLALRTMVEDLAYIFMYPICNGTYACFKVFVLLKSSWDKIRWIVIAFCLAGFLHELPDTVVSGVCLNLPDQTKILEFIN